MILKFVRDRPWLWIVLLFAILIYGWVFLLRLANEHQPDTVPLQTIERNP